MVGVILMHYKQYNNPGIDFLFIIYTGSPASNLEAGFYFTLETVSPSLIGSKTVSTRESSCNFLL